MGAIVASELSTQLRLLGVVLIGPVNPNPGLADVFNARIATVEKSTLLLHRLRPTHADRFRRHGFHG